MKKNTVIICAILMLSFSTIAIAAKTDKEPEINEYDLLLDGDESSQSVEIEQTPQIVEDAAADAYSKTDDIDAIGTEQFANAGELFQYWQESRPNHESSPYPDYICGVWSSDGSMENLTFAVTKDEVGEAGKEEILSLIRDKPTASFTYQSYPYAELLAIQLDLQQRLGTETGTYGIGIYEMDNVIRIDYDKTNENSEAFIKECFSRFDNRVVFKSGDGAIVSQRKERGGGFDGIVNGLWTRALEHKS